MAEEKKDQVQNPSGYLKLIWKKGVDLDGFFGSKSYSCNSLGTPHVETQNLRGNLQGSPRLMSCGKLLAQGSQRGLFGLFGFFA